MAVTSYALANNPYSRGAAHRGRRRPAVRQRLHRPAVARTLESTEARTGGLTVSATVGEEYGESTVDLQLLAPAQWAGERDGLDSEFSTSRREELGQQVALMIEESVPVKLDLLRSAVAKRFGRKKTSRKVNTVIDRLIPDKLLRKEGNVLNEFVWPRADGRRPGRMEPCVVVGGANGI